MARRRRRGRSLRRTVGRAVVSMTVVIGLLVAAVAAVVAVLDRADAARPVAEQCAVSLDGTNWLMTPEQADNAALIAAVGARRGLPARAVTIAIATALQESKLSNIDYGDRDSLGLFQQRPSQGWGTVEQILDPVYSTGRFYDGLVTVPGYQELPITEAAQAVQRSGFPEAYAQHEGRSRAWASALTGWSTSALTCTLHDPDAAGSTDAFSARLARDLGALSLTVEAATDDTPLTVQLDATPLGAGATDPTVQARMAWTVAQWAIAVAADQRVTSVAVADQVWTREDGAWAPADAPVGAGAVRVSLAG